MSPLTHINRLLDSVDHLFGGERAIDRDPRVSLDHMRYRQASGLGSVSVSLSKIARPLIVETLREVREKKANDGKAGSKDKG
ncbi:MAG: hypothetical protein KA250_10210 [Verrucomicrobiales bacterium]|jgi:hypothetical protein|nr:hypothetical protein [Verrucomicrobiales bacterium]MBP9225798.1 hypothetical protein [Verrucomicrobiales bacterium]